MKKNLTQYFGALAIGTTLTAAALAQTAVKETTTTTTNSAGTISEFSPETIVIRSESSPEPLRYSYTKTTTYVDETGAPVTMETVKSGLPVTVYYTTVGDRLVANRVVVRKATVAAPGAPAVIEKKTTITNSAGTISEFSPETIVIRSESSPEPLRYSYTKTTTYVDETGAPVTIETVKSGLPVTVYYTKVGDRLVASRVVVRKATVTTPAAPAIIEKKTTTTTTTEDKK